MKVDQINAKNIKDLKSSQQTGSRPETSFEEHLNKAAETQNQRLHASEVERTNSVSGMEGATIQSRPVQQLEKVMSTLELYHNAVGNSDISLPKMEGLITEMNKEKDELLPYINILPEEDKLRDIIKDTALVILDETNKFYRSLIVQPPRH